MDKPNIFRTSNFYMGEGDALYIEIDYEAGADTLTIELAGEDGTVEAVPTGDLVDKDGNVYTTVIINNQEWIVENFKSTQYADGISIPVVTADATWIGDTAGAMCYFDNDKTTNEPLYGALYNWWAVNNAKGLAYLERGGTQEAGWRVPTVADWSNLIAFAGGQYGAGVKLRKDGAGVWTQTPNTATNDYGFSVMPAGRRDGTTGAFDEDGSTGKLWTSTLDLSPTAPFYTYFFFFLVIDTVTILKVGEEWDFQ